MKREQSLRYKRKLHEIYAIEPNTLGSRWLTYLYRTLTFPLKSMPFYIIIPTSGIIALAIYMLLGNLSIAVVSVLQYGF